MSIISVQQQFLDHLISELNVRFTESSSQFLLQFTQLLPSELIKNLTKTKNTDFDELIKFYEDDLPLSRGFSAELELWKNYWSSETCKADAEALNTPEKALKQLDKDLYPNIYTLLTFADTVPVTSCECERSISMLRLIFKEYYDTRKTKWASNDAVSSSNST